MGEGEGEGGGEGEGEGMRSAGRRDTNVGPAYLLSTTARGWSGNYLKRSCFYYNAAKSKGIWIPWGPEGSTPQ